jgi:hypothetical protein
MPSIGFAAPLLPGTTEIDREAMKSCWNGERNAAYEDSRRRAGITRETTWLQSTPAGDMAVVVLEADDLEAALGAIATSDEPFDTWFREHLQQVHGFSLAEGFLPPEMILDYHSDAAGR